MATRIAIPDGTVTEVLIRSRRRCCLCSGLQGDIEIKQGQIAHLDRDASSNRPDNLAFLCLPHHDVYDSRTSQSKGFTIDEVKIYRAELYARIQHLALKTVRSLPSLAPSADEQQEALQFHTSTHRTRSVVLSVANGPKTLEQINSEIPPSDIAWTRAIVAEPVELGWIRRTPGLYSQFELTLNGRRMLDVLSQLPEDAKNRAWLAVWRPQDV
jgi:hypothetical protein